MNDVWLKVLNLPELAYKTKGKRDKRLPLLPAMRRLLGGNGRRGLLFVRRRVAEGNETPPLLGRSLADLAEEFRRRCRDRHIVTAAARRTIRDGVLHDAGATSYDEIRGEFMRIARALGWPKQSTLKDLRHLFATSIANAGMPEPARQYLLGHSSGRAAIHIYTHINQLPEQYEAAVTRTMSPALSVLESRLISDAAA